jgi:hypothetical protein
MIKVIQAQAAEAGKNTAMVHINMWDKRYPDAIHSLKLHQDKDGVWWPELKVSMANCGHKDIQQIRCMITSTLHELIGILQGEEAAGIKIIADMVSK